MMEKVKNNNTGTDPNQQQGGSGGGGMSAAAYFNNKLYGGGTGDQPQQVQQQHAQNSTNENMSSDNPYLQDRKEAAMADPVFGGADDHTFHPPEDMNNINNNANTNNSNNNSSHSSSTFDSLSHHQQQQFQQMQALQQQQQQQAKDLLAQQQAAQVTQQQAQAAQQQLAQTAGTIGNIGRQQFEQRWAAVVEQERQLKTEAAQLDKYERQLLSLMRNDEPNFPRKCCCISPIVFHDIQADITAERQSFVKSAYVNWWLTCTLLLFNFVCSLTFLILPDKGDPNDAMPAHLVVSIIFALFGIPLSFVLWYWPLYKACGTGSSSQHVMSYIGLTIAIMFNIFASVGAVGLGSCGMLFIFHARNEKETHGGYIAPLVYTIILILQTVFFTFLLYRMKCVYGPLDKTSIAKANAEIAQKGVMSALRGK